MERVTSHSEHALRWIKDEMKLRGIDDYRFCVENDCYICDRNGNFYSVCKRQLSKVGNFIEHYRIAPLFGSTDKYGYRTYRVTVNGNKQHLKGHRMMLNAWIGEEPTLSVNHKDGNKQNNALKNLEWCTVAENNAHAIRTGLVNPYKPNIKNRTKEIVERLRKEYPVGCRVELLEMNDVQAPPVGTQGTVTGVDDTGSIMVTWDNGSGLNVVYGEDFCRVVNPDEVPGSVLTAIIEKDGSTRVVGPVPKIDISQIPQSAIDGLARAVISAAEKYYKDPEHEKAFQEWKKKRESGESGRA